MSTFDAFLQPVLLAREPRLNSYLTRLDAFRHWVLTDVEAQANYTDRYAPAALQAYDREGRILNRIVSNPQYNEQHQECYRRGIIALPYDEAAPHLVSFAMGYLLSQADISLHCPVTLTGAVAYVIGYHVSEKLRAEYLPELTRMAGETKTGGTWATEKHGGSDVGATTTVAKPSKQGFTLHGLKWFASNANSGLALATARPEGAPKGSAGLGLYLVPSHLSTGEPNHMLIRRLKDKLGTKGLPTGEIELNGAEAIEIAAPPAGFKLMMEALEYSRVHNAVGSAGVQRRALTEAIAWCNTRETFGAKLIDRPMVQDELLRLQLQFEAGSLLAFESALTFDAALADPTKRTWLRLVTALAKYLTAEYAIQSCRATLELIGGNAYTSDYPIARLYRDAQVLTVWEGPANIQALELLRLLSSKYRGAEIYEQRIRGIIERTPDSLATLIRTLKSRLAEDISDITLVARDRESSERYARKLLHRLAQSLGYALLCEHAAEDPHNELRLLAAQRYLEDIDPPKLGAEDPRIRKAALQLIDAPNADLLSRGTAH
ncbi:MAG TPA: acyl-CoA dehydrogenase family protein [Candidatus Koribacter sp.]|jgi:alkylation response protein AidB-like acyl-CoA dehydrogenase